MGEKIVKLGIKRDNNFMYYVKGNDVVAVPRRAPGQAAQKMVKIASAGVDLDHTAYLYYVDADGDISRKEFPRADAGDEDEDE